MKQLLLMRHAKSDWDDTSLSDFDRPLAPRGQKNAPFMGRMAKKMDMVPDKIVCSPAQRAKETAELFAASAGFGGEIVYEKKLYNGSPEVYMRVLSQYSATPVLMLIGHNPVMEELLGLMCTSHSNVPAIFPTSGFACLEIDIPAVKEIYPGAGQLSCFIHPKMLRKLTDNPDQD